MNAGASITTGLGTFAQVAEGKLSDRSYVPFVVRFILKQSLMENIFAGVTEYAGFVKELEEIRDISLQYLHVPNAKEEAGYQFRSLCLYSILSLLAKLCRAQSICMFSATRDEPPFEYGIM